MPWSGWARARAAADSLISPAAHAALLLNSSRTDGGSTGYPGFGPYWFNRRRPTGGPPVRVKGRTHPRTLVRTVRDPDFQPESCGHRARMEGRCLCPSISPNAHPRVPEKARERTAGAMLRASRSGGEAGRRATRDRAGVRVLELAGAEGRNRSPASAERRGVHAGVRGRRRRRRCANCCRTIPVSRASALAGGTTGLHLAVRHPDAVRLLLEHGADPNAARRRRQRDAAPFRGGAWDARERPAFSSMPALTFTAPATSTTATSSAGQRAKATKRVINLLLERGARHHIFSAMALGDRDLVQTLVEEDPECLSRRRSRFENGHTPLHAAFAPPDGLGFLAGRPDYAMLELLIELGADVEATDDKGRTPLAIAMLRGDREAIAPAEGGRSEGAAGGAAGARSSRRSWSAVASSVKKSSPMFSVRDMRATVRWYESIGFTVAGSSTRTAAS